MIHPMLATQGSIKIDDYKDFLFNLKIDGHRAVVEKKGEEVKIYSRYQNLLTRNFPEIKEEFSKIEGDFIVDGELVVMGEGGPNRAATTSRSGKIKPLEIAYAAKKAPATYFAFDIVQSQEHGDMRGTDLLGRVEVLNHEIHQSERIKILEYVDSKGAVKMMEDCYKHDWEGLMAKNPNSKYQESISDKRSKDWIKMKLTKEEDLEVLGFSSETREISALFTWNGKVNFGVAKTTYDVWKPVLQSMSSGKEKINFVNGKSEEGHPIKKGILITVRHYGKSEAGMMISPQVQKIWRA